VSLVLAFPFQRVYELTSAGRRDRALDVVFANLDELAETRRYELCDQVLDEVNLSRLDTHVAIGFLSASYPFRRYLSARSALLARVREWLLSLGKSTREVDSLLRGLL
jgi:hypothetical protein